MPKALAIVAEVFPYSSGFDAANPGVYSTAINYLQDSNNTIVYILTISLLLPIDGELCSPLAGTELAQFGSVRWYV